MRIRIYCRFTTRDTRQGQQRDFGKRVLSVEDLILPIGSVLRVPGAPRQLEIVDVIGVIGEHGVLKSVRMRAKGFLNGDQERVEIAATRLLAAGWEAFNGAWSTLEDDSKWSE
jgi:hypothetical protein